MNKLKNKVAVATGASKGIGVSIAKYFAAEGTTAVAILPQVKKVQIKW